MTSLDLRNIASAGGNLVVNADKFTALDLKNIASSGVGTKCKLTIKKQENLLDSTVEILHLPIREM